MELPHDVLTDEVSIDESARRHSLRMADGNHVRGAVPGESK